MSTYFIVVVCEANVLNNAEVCRCTDLGLVKLFVLLQGAESTRQATRVGRGRLGIRIVRAVIETLGGQGHVIDRTVGIQ